MDEFLEFFRGNCNVSFNGACIKLCNTMLIYTV